ncbi:MAG: universal stress protein [Planctomycetales bacterium]|nr:universal stress protein [Planctomycetales bacterium]
MIKRVLVGIADQTYTVSATRHAIDVARPSDAKLTAMSVLDSDTIRHQGPTPIGAGAVVKEWRDQLLQESEQVIHESNEAFERLCKEATMKFELISRSGDPLKEFIDAARYQDFFVVGLHRLFEHGLLDEAPDNLVKLISSGVYPMLAVTDTYRPVERVLIAYSGSVESARTVRSFLHHHHVWPISEIQVVSFGSSSSSEAPGRLIDVLHYLKDHQLDCEIEFVKGDPRLLHEYAKEWKADMIVLGNSAKNLIRRRIFGETALKTIREANTPLYLAQ